MAAAKKVLDLTKDKETKGYLVFSGSSAVTPIYVAKDVCAELGITDKLRITIEPVA